MIKKIILNLKRVDLSNFLAGYGSILTLIPETPAPKINRHRINFPKTAEEGLRKNWEAVGRSLYHAMSIIDKEIKTNGISRRYNKP